MHVAFTVVMSHAVTLLILLLTSHVNLQLLAQTIGMFACIVVTQALQRQKEQFSTVILEHGIRPAIMVGVVLMQMWSADSLVLASQLVQHIAYTHATSATTIDSRYLGSGEICTLSTMNHYCKY